MKPKEEATEGTVLSPEDSEAINEALSFLRKATVKIYESALDHKIAHGKSRRPTGMATSSPDYPLSQPEITQLNVFVRKLPPT
jgi:hypothetical protein